MAGGEGYKLTGSAEPTAMARRRGEKAERAAERHVRAGGLTGGDVDMVQATPSGKREGRDVGEGRRTLSVSGKFPLCGTFAPYLP